MDPTRVNGFFVLWRAMGADGITSSSCTWLLIVAQTTVASAIPFSNLTELENIAEKEKWGVDDMNRGEWIGKMLSNLVAGIMATARWPRAVPAGRTKGDVVNTLLDRGINMLRMVERKDDKLKIK